MRTKPRNEMKVVGQVEKKGVEVYFPRVPEIRIWSDRKKKVLVPLFSSYVFVYADAEERGRAIRETIGAVNYIMYKKRPAIVKEQEIENIKISLIVPERVKIEKTKIGEGDFVQIKSGPFKGLTGNIVQVRGNYKILVNIEEIGYSLSVEVLPSEVQHEF